MVGSHILRRNWKEWSAYWKYCLKERVLNCLTVIHQKQFCTLNSQKAPASLGSRFLWWNVTAFDIMMKSAILACFEDADFEFSLAINTDQQWPQALKGSVREKWLRVSLVVIYAERKRKKTKKIIYIWILARVYISNRSEKLLLVIVAEEFTIRYFAHWKKTKKQPTEALMRSDVTNSAVSVT